MSNWIEIIQGDGCVSVKSEGLVGIALQVGAKVKCVYGDGSRHEFEFDSGSAARAAYDSLLAQLRGQEQSPPKLSKALMDMLREPAAVEQSAPGPHIDGCPCEECVAERARIQRKDAQAQYVPPSPFTAQEVPLTPGHRPDCTCSDCTRNRVDGTVTVPQGTCFPISPVASTVPSEEEIMVLFSKAMSDTPSMAPEHWRTFCMNVRRQLLERQPKHKELSEEQIEKLAQDGFEMVHGMATWYSAPADARHDCIRCVKQVLNRLKWEGRLL